MDFLLWTAFVISCGMAVCSIYGCIKGTKEKLEEEAEEVETKKEEVELIAGVWQFKTDNPFARAHQVEIIEVRDGWVNYKWLKSSMFQNDSMETKSFVHCYRKLKEEPNGIT